MRERKSGPMPRGAVVRAPGRPRKGIQRRPVMGLSRRVADALELMVLGPVGGQPLKRDQAALVVGLKPDTLRKAFENPVVVSAYHSKLAALRNSERATNLHVAAEIRDDPSLRASPAGQKVRLSAIGSIENPGGRGDGVTVNVNTLVSGPAPGYLVDISEFPTERLDAIERHALIGRRPPQEIEGKVR